jgi:hypothetical protein
VKVLREVLDKRGFQHVQIIAADYIGAGSWDIVKDFADKELFNAVSIVGYVVQYIYGHDEYVKL